MKKQALGGFILGGMLIVSSIAIFYSMISNIEPLIEVGEQSEKGVLHLLDTIKSGEVVLTSEQQIKKINAVLMLDRSSRKVVVALTQSIYILVFVMFLLGLVLLWCGRCFMRVQAKNPQNPEKYLGSV